MMNLRSVCIIVLTFAAKVYGEDENPATPENHDVVAYVGIGLAEWNPQWIYAPSLIVRSGCQVYEAVDENGYFSGGLAPRRGPSSGCSDTSHYQVLSRAKAYPQINKIGIMYAWFFPKTQGNRANHHRFNWLYAVVWINGKFNDSLTKFDGAHSLYGLWTSGNGFSRAGNFAEYDGHPALAKDYVNDVEVILKDAGHGNYKPTKYWINDWSVMESKATDSLKLPYVWQGVICPLRDESFNTLMRKAEPLEW